MQGFSLNIPVAEHLLDEGVRAILRWEDDGGSCSPEYQPDDRRNSGA